MESVESKIITIFAEQLGIDKDQVTRASTREDLGIDSLDEMEVLMEIEDEFSLSIDDDVAQPWKNVGDVIDYVMKATGGEATGAMFV